jgi:hypothetical protein
MCTLVKINIVSYRKNKHRIVYLFTVAKKWQHAKLKSCKTKECFSYNANVVNRGMFSLHDMILSHNLFK